MVTHPNKFGPLVEAFVAGLEKRSFVRQFRRCKDRFAANCKSLRAKAEGGLVLLLLLILAETAEA